jgi:hypothetical protein
MNRREAIRLLAAGATVPLVPGSLLAALREARALVGTQVVPRTLNSHQNATVKTMAEMIIPRTETPGATDVGASEFIDLMLTEWYDDGERNRFLNGLADVDTRSRTLFGEEFIGCSLAQQAEILTELGEKMTEETERARDKASADSGSEPEANESFYSMLRRLTLTAYYTSEAGATGELHFEIIPGRYDGCVPAQSDKEGAARR